MRGSSVRSFIIALRSCAVLAAFGAAETAHAVTLDWVTVGDPGNANDTINTGTNPNYGAVADVFKIMKYEMTNTNYAAFLNAVAKTDTYSLYSFQMGTDTRGGITRSGASGNFTYAVRTNMGDKPVNFVNWYDAARFSNWLQNGQPNGLQTGTTTENGAYTLNGLLSGTAPAKNPNAQYWLPTENEWYKAAYYKGGSTNAGYWTYATQSNTDPTQVTSGTTGIGSAGSAGNFANYDNGASTNGQIGNVTSVGTNGGPSAYGAFDLSGNLFEMNDLGGTGGTGDGLRGGAFGAFPGVIGLSSSYRVGPNSLTVEGVGAGFRLAAVPEPGSMGLAAIGGIAAAGWWTLRRRRRSRRRIVDALATVTAAVALLGVHPAHAITLDWVTVGDPGNVADTNPAGYGAVADEFQVMTFEFTNADYAAFLNAVDPNGSNPFSVYNTNMDSNARGGITNTGTTNGSRYAFKSNMGDKPVNYVSWFDAARVANWLQNGQGSGSTETGAYTLIGGQISGTIPSRNSDAQFFIPSESQWFKAAYYKGGSTNAGYWDYATRSDTRPSQVTSGSTGVGSAGSVGNFANYNNSAVWNGQTGNVTTVGTNGGPSAYGAFDMTGNILEWIDIASVTARGGGYSNFPNSISASFNSSRGSDDELPFLGFRLARAAAVPEPSTYCMALAGLACGGFAVWQRKRA